MSVKPVQHQQGFFQETIRPCFEKIYETIKSIANCILNCLKTIFCCWSSSNDKEIQTVTEMRSEQIQDLAEHITTHVMSRLNQGIKGEKSIPDPITGDPLMLTTYDRDSHFLQTMKPLVANVLQKAFVNDERELQNSRPKSDFGEICIATCLCRPPKITFGR